MIRRDRSPRRKKRAKRRTNHRRVRAYCKAINRIALDSVLHSFQNPIRVERWEQA